MKWASGALHEPAEHPPNSSKRCSPEPSQPDLSRRWFLHSATATLAAASSSEPVDSDLFTCLLRAMMRAYSKQNANLYGTHSLSFWRAHLASRLHPFLRRPRLPRLRVAVLSLACKICRCTSAVFQYHLYRARKLHVVDLLPSYCLTDLPMTKTPINSIVSHNGHGPVPALGSSSFTIKSATSAFFVQAHSRLAKQR